MSIDSLCLPTLSVTRRNGLATEYKCNDILRHFCGMVDGFALFSVADDTVRWQFLRQNISDVEHLHELVDYFDTRFTLLAGNRPRNTMTELLSWNSKHSAAFSTKEVKRSCGNLALTTCVRGVAMASDIKLAIPTRQFGSPLKRFKRMKNHR